MSDPQTPALVALAEHNQMLVVADIDHRSQMIPDAITAQMPALAQAGVRHLFIEVDPNEYSPNDVAAVGDAFGRMVAEAQKQGIEVVAVDDRSQARARDAKYPKEAELFTSSGTYGANEEDIAALIQRAPDPARMRDYIDLRKNEDETGVAYRNIRMVENIALAMRDHPDDKAMLLVGAAHTNQNNDIDEMLRVRGFQTTTALIKASDAPYPEAMVSAPDKADVTLDAFTGEATAAKDPASGRVRHVADPNAVGWRNDEPFAPTHSDAIRCAMDAAGNVACAWSQGLDNARAPSISEAETGQMPPPVTARQPAPRGTEGPQR